MLVIGCQDKQPVNSHPPKLEVYEAYYSDGELQGFVAIYYDQDSVRQKITVHNINGKDSVNADELSKLVTARYEATH